MVRGVKQSNRTKAHDAWGAGAPAWVLTLADACDSDSVRRVAARLELSPALVSLVIRHAHHGSYEYAAQRVRDVLCSPNCACPVLGDITVAACRAEQKKPFTSINPLAVAVYRACRGGCPHYKGDKA